jgi:hypothetical protein
VFCLLAIFSLGASLDRSGNSLDTKISEARSKNIPATLAKAAHKRALQTLKSAEQSAMSECASGRGRLCRDRETEVKLAREQVLLTETKLASAGSAKSVNSMATRIAKLVSVDAEKVNTYFPLALPFGLWLGGIVFIGVGFAPGATPKEQEPAKDLPLEYKIKLFIEENKASQKEAAEHFGISPSTVSRRLRVVR